MATTWTIAIDWDRKGTFDGAYDNVTADVISANWFLGMRRPYGDVADDSMLNLVLRNDQRNGISRFYSPENSSSPLFNKLVPYRPVIIQSNDGTTTRTHWRGWIESIQPQVNKNGKRQLKIVAAGPMEFMRAADTSITLQEFQRTDQIIAELIKQVVFPPALTGAFIVGISRLGIDTKLVGAPMYSDLDTGVVTLTMAGDNWVRQGGSTSDRETFNVYQAIQDVTAAEHGRFLFNREGMAIFWNRTRLLQSITPAATFNDSMQDLEYVYGALDELKNEVLVVCHPRTISAGSNEILWQLEGEITIPQGGNRTVVARYRDEFGNRIGGRNVTVTGVTFGTGTGSVVMTPKANSADLVIVNTGAGAATLTNCVVQGQKITDFGRMEAKARDGLSATYYGRRTLRQSVPAIDNLTEAQAIADFELARRKDPRGSVRQMNLMSHGLNGGGHHANQLALTLGSKITVAETQTAHDSDYFIIGEAHRLSGGATLFETTWYLEPAAEVA